LDVPITVAQARETGALGAALGAGVGVGIFPNYEAGIAAMTRPNSTFLPDPTMKAMYRKRYDAWIDLSERMRGFWRSLI
jgi:L-xylulokinase